MSQLSKHFYEVMKDKTCADIVHPSMTCFQSARLGAVIGLLGAARFYLPVCFLPMLFKINKWNQKEEWIKFLKYYGRCVIFGFSAIGMTFAWICVYYNIFKKFYFSTFVFVPALLGTSLCGLLPENRLHIDGFGLLNMSIEFCIKQSKYALIKKLRNSKLFATVMFMACNSIVMCGLLKTKSHHFWFINPAQPEEEYQSKQPNSTKKSTATYFNKIFPVTETKCAHKHQSCDDYFKQEFKKAVTFALVINFVKVVLPNFQKFLTRPSRIPMDLVRKFDYGLFAFLVLSNGIFKLSQCLLNRRDNSNYDKNNSIAGFLAGVCYIFCPKYVIFTLGSTTAVEMIWKLTLQYYKENQKQLPRLLEFITKIPIKELIFMIPLSLLAQNKFVYPQYTKSYVHRFIAIASLNRSDFIANNYNQIMAQKIS